MEGYPESAIASKIRNLGRPSSWPKLRRRSTTLVNAGVSEPPGLDWFHIAMRLQHAEKTACNLPADTPERENARAVIIAEVDRLHWRIWNGKAKDAQITLERIRAVMPAF